LFVIYRDLRLPQLPGLALIAQRLGHENDARFAVMRVLDQLRPDRGRNDIGDVASEPGKTAIQMPVDDFLPVSFLAFLSGDEIGQRFRRVIIYLRDVIPDFVVRARYGDLVLLISLKFEKQGVIPAVLTLVSKTNQAVIAIDRLDIPP